MNSRTKAILFRPLTMEHPIKTILYGSLAPYNSIKWTDVHGLCETDQFITIVSYKCDKTIVILVNLYSNVQAPLLSKLTLLGLHATPTTTTRI